MRTFAEKPKATQQNASAKVTKTDRAHFAQSHEVNSLLHLQRTTGNQAVQRLVQANAEELNTGSATKASTRFVHDFSRIPVHSSAPGGIQPKLMVNTPGDIYEQEADRVSKQVMRMPEQPLERACPCGGGCPKCQTEQSNQEHERLQTKSVQASDAVKTSAPPIVHEMLRSPGQPLDAKTRAYFEPRFGHDFSQVRIHTSERAAQSARAINAMAYTAGSEIVFGTGKYAPETTEGKRLLAHELAHVQQQHGSTVGGPPSVVQRQPLSSAPPSNPPAWATSPGYEETAHAPSVRVRIVAHASPRWRGARGAAAADRRNLELSQRRADAVHFEVEKLLAGHLGAGASVNVDVRIEEQEGTVGVEQEARGSRDTLPEAKGDRSDNAQQGRRVDVIIESSQRISGSAGASRPLLTRPTASEFWHVSVDMSSGAAFVAAGGLLALTLSNDRTGERMTGNVLAGGIGPKTSLGASRSIWSDPTGFYTDEPKNFEDFDGKWIQYASGGVSLFLGYEWSYLSFLGFGSGAAQIDVGGWSAGTAGIGGSTVYGPLLLQGSYPPKDPPIKDSDKTVSPYERTERGEDKHKILFPTESATLNDLEVDILDSFLASVVASNR